MYTYVRVCPYGTARTTHTYSALAVSKLGLPGVYFSYKFSPLVIVKWEEHVPWAEYLANLMAIFGGVTTVVALFDVRLVLPPRNA